MHFYSSRSITCIQFLLISVDKSFQRISDIPIATLFESLFIHDFERKKYARNIN